MACKEKTYVYLRELYTSAYVLVFCPININIIPFDIILSFKRRLASYARLLLTTKLTSSLKEPRASKS